MTKVKKQRLRAEDVEDLAVMAALLQDSHTRLGEMAFDLPEKQFMCALQRPCREAGDATDTSPARVATALVFGCIAKAQYRNIDATRLDADLILLTITTEPGADTLYRIGLVFEGGGEVRLESDCIHCRLEDFGEIEQSGLHLADHFS